MHAYKPATSQQGQIWAQHNYRIKGGNYGLYTEAVVYISLVIKFIAEDDTLGWHIYLGVDFWHLTNILIQWN